MAKIYISSTCSDLKDYREAVYRTLRQMKHDVKAMEDYVATDQRPLDKCLADVTDCDVYVGILAWRYGYIPHKENPAQKSITELEYRKAAEMGKACLIFLVNRNAQWPPSLMDAITGENEGGKRIAEFRQELEKEKLAGLFTTPDELAKQVSVAVSQWEASSNVSGLPLPPDAPSYIKQAVAALSSFNPAERKGAVESLGQIDEPAAREALRGALRHPFRDVRIHTALVLAQSKDERAVPGLIEALHDKDDDVRWDANQALGQIGAPAVQNLLDVLRDEDWKVRWAAAEALGRIGDAAAVRGLLDALRDRDKNVRGKAVEALGQIGDAAAVPRLIEQLLDTERPTVTSSTRGDRICDFAAKAPNVSARRRLWPLSSNGAASKELAEPPRKEIRRPSG